MFFRIKFKRWLKKASLDELDNAYEKIRQDWVSKGCPGGDRSPEMEAINKQMEHIRYKDVKTIKNPNKRWTDEARWDK